VEERARNRAGRPKARERKPSVLAKNACSGRVPFLGKPRIPDRGPLAADLEPQERSLGRRDRALRKEPRLRPRANLQLDPRTAHDITQIDRVPLGKARCIRIGAAATRVRRSLGDAALRGSIDHTPG
jgi:hypothetical protein